MPLEPPGAFSRPIANDGRTEAHFRTVRLPTGLFPAGRVYHCEHLTPDLVWRAPWFAHSDGFTGIEALTIASPDPEAEAGRYAAACRGRAERADEGWLIRLCDARVAVRSDPAPRFDALDLRFADLSGIEARAAALPSVHWERHGADAAELALPTFDLRLRCRGER